MAGFQHLGRPPRALDAPCHAALADTIGHHLVHVALRRAEATLVWISKAILQPIVGEGIPIGPQVTNHL